MCFPVPSKHVVSQTQLTSRPLTCPAQRDFMHVPLLFLSPLDHQKMPRRRWLLNRTLKYEYSFCAVLLQRGKYQLILHSFSYTTTMSPTHQQDRALFLPSVFQNQDGLSSLSVSVIYLMNKFGNLDELPNLLDCPFAKQRQYQNLLHSIIVVRNK